MRFEINERHAAIRHYSALRFAMLSVFAAITIALLHAKFSADMTAAQATLRLPLMSRPVSLINLVGGWVSLVFLTFEVALNFYLCGLWAQVPRTTPMPVYRRHYIIWPVRVMAVSMPLGAFMLWCMV